MNELCETPFDSEKIKRLLLSYVSIDVSQRIKQIQASSFDTIQLDLLFQSLNSESA